MNTNTLLIAKKSSDTNRLVSEAANRTGRNLEQINDSRCAFQWLRRDLSEIDLIIIDLDPGIHSMAILEALAASENRPPVIVITGLEEYDMTPIAHRHGATACIGKPFTVDELVSLIEQICPRSELASSWSSDLWGHPHRCHREITRKCAAGCERRTLGRAPKFSAISSK